MLSAIAPNRWSVAESDCHPTSGKQEAGDEPDLVRCQTEFAEGLRAKGNSAKSSALKLTDNR